MSSAASLQELRERGVVRTRAPLGDYAEYLAMRVYGGELAANSGKSYDLLAADGRRVQVKARTVGAATRAGAVFSAFRSFDSTSRCCSASTAPPTRCSRRVKYRPPNSKRPAGTPRTSTGA
ncbi:hypothetical protein L3Q67_44990 (plasmid) [Saccharothrix sp. AJ9571]|nr:hypothetical protein L3Q67_44990 [Saccharothrix sp. AJ9571]